MPARLSAHDSNDHLAAQMSQHMRATQASGSPGPLRMLRFKAAIVLSVLLLASCASTPPSSPSQSSATRSASPSLSATPRPFVTNPATNPASTAVPVPTSAPSSGVVGWPLTAVSKPTFGPDGTVYLLTGSRDAQNQDQNRLVAVDAAGRVKPGWPLEGRPGSSFRALAMGPSGSVYVEECGASSVGCLLHRLDVNGQELRGWPFKVPTAFACPVFDPCSSFLVIGSDGTAYLTHWHQTERQTRITAIDAVGKIKIGWPVAAADLYGWFSEPQLSSDGTVFILTWPAGGNRAANLLAFTPAGSPRRGWPVSVPVGGGFRPGPAGTVVVWSYEPIADPSNGGLCRDASRTVFTVLDRDARALPGWPRGSKGFASRPVVGTDDTVYYLSAQGNLYAHDRAGDVHTGWPVSVPGAFPGCGGYGPFLAPDGTVYALGEEVVASSRDGERWRYRPTGALAGQSCDLDGRNQPAPALGADGTTYVATFVHASVGETVDVVALDRQGRVKPGWPFRLPMDGRTSSVDSLDVSPDGRLYVFVGACREGSISTLLALDPDGRISR